MKLCIFGKFPPIQGGVSTRTYACAHALAKRGHEVHVITNAGEVTAPYRMHMRPEDWERCGATYARGFVKVHWTESYGKSEWHIPDSTPFVTKLTSLGLKVARQDDVDLIYSHYMEPYAVAGHLVARTTGLPHIVRTAGSDIGRLWRLEQYQELYDEVFRSAHTIITSPAAAPKLTAVGVAPERITSSQRKHDNLMDVFSATGPRLDLEHLAEEVRSGGQSDLMFGSFDPSLRYIGVYGKLGRDKGTIALVDALARLKKRGIRIGLLAMAHARPGAESAFREHVLRSDLGDRVVQIPFLPHWRVPEFIRSCIAVCCLEQDFPIAFHDPVIAREVLTCGGCLIASAEVAAKLPSPDRIQDGQNCIVVDNVRDVASLEAKIGWALENPDEVTAIRQRAQSYAAAVAHNESFAEKLEALALAAIQPARVRSQIRAVALS